MDRLAPRGTLVTQKEPPATLLQDRAAAQLCPAAGLPLLFPVLPVLVAADRGADQSRLAQGGQDQDQVRGQDGKNALRASAALPGPHALAHHHRRSQRKPSPVACPCGPSGSSSSSGKRGLIRLQKSLPRRRRPRAAAQAGRPPGEALEAVTPAVETSRPEPAPEQSAPPRTPVRKRTKQSNLRDRGSIRYTCKVGRAGFAGDQALPRARQQNRVRPSHRRGLFKFGAY